MLNELTPEQEQILEETKEKWIGYIFENRLDLDKKSARESIEWLYKLANLREPHVTYFKSPMAAQFASNMLESVEEDKEIPAINEISNTINYLKTGDINDQRVIDNWNHIDENWNKENLISKSINFVKRALKSYSKSGSQFLPNETEKFGELNENSERTPQSIVKDTIVKQLKEFSKKEINSKMLSEVVEELSVFLSTRFATDKILMSFEEMDSLSDSEKSEKIKSLEKERESIFVKNIKDLKYYPFSIIGNVSDYNWMAFYDFFESIGIFKNDNYDNYKKMFLSGIFDQIQYDDLCMVIELPTTIGRDDENRLHGSNGPAIAWDDDFKLYFWRGVPVTEKMIETPELLTREEIITESNVEVRRAIHERMGNEMYLDVMGADELDRAMDEYDKEVVLYRSKERDQSINEYLYYLKVICTSTDREYVLNIRPDRASSAMDARASTFNKTLEEYRPDIQT